MKETFNILAAPSEALQRIHEKPTWLAPLAFCIGAFFVLTWLGGCWTNLSQALHWSNLLGPALISPLIVGIVCLGTAALLYLLNMILSGAAKSPSFRTMFSVSVHCGIIFLLGEVVNFLLIHANLLGEYASPLPNRFPVGLDLLLLGSDEPNLHLAILLHSTSVFVLWYLIVLSLGMRIVTGASKARSVAMVISLWCVVVGLTLGLVYVAGGTTMRIRI